MTKTTGRVAFGAALVLAFSGALVPSAAHAEELYPGGGFAAQGPGGTGTIGYAWADDDNEPVGHVTVAHLTSRVGDVLTTVPSQDLRRTSIQTEQVTGEADLSIVSLIRDPSDVGGTIARTDRTRLEVVDYALGGEVTPGTRVCHSGHNWTTATLPEVCGTITAIGDTTQCHANGTGSSSCAVWMRTDRADGFVGGPGDSGAAVYEYLDGTAVRLIGTFKATTTDGQGIIEPTYAAIEIFGGHPLVSSTRNTSTTPDE